ncbi:Bardet-Biedl syndrome 9 [Trypanosoma theileri]|uniref:Bardet-Biedl syndrome 9 n=1 Tax=Trypanosoma theileri TaxID=67003 RepID=A0A1X0NUH9_9TRYP|nr:Bardet-Biedl syndrome 9 [Trypanosoma theileri]ORC88367.1 Bardet-Biedl syndrome 9 [Trypanosoma theileri]
MGSLFKLRDHWYSNYHGEEFSHTSALAVGNVDNDAAGENEIILGSFSGLLRVLRPTKKGAAQPEDTLFEREFGEPILQVACRPLEPVMGGAARNLLAILFPKRLVLARVLRDKETMNEEETVGGALDVSYRLGMYHEARLKHTSYNFTYGTFGRTGHEMVCVQSMNGQLTIVDHNMIVLHCFIPSTQFLLPGCLAYSPQRDYFITNNSAMNLVCYTFSSLTSTSVKQGMRDNGNAENDEREGEGGEGEALKEKVDDISPIWTFSLGEDVVAIEVCRHTRGLDVDDSDIVLLCQFTLFVLSLNGELRYSKRLDVEGLCLTSYPLPSVDACNLLIGTIRGSVNVYSDMSLEWSAKMSSGAPQCLVVSELFKTNGFIVSLSTDGVVAVNYLGTDPEENPIQPLESRETEYAEMESELRRVQHAIKQASNNETVSVKNEVHVETTVHASWGSPTAITEGQEGTTVSTLTLRNDSKKDILGEVTVIVKVVEPIKVNVQQSILKGIPAEGMTQIPFRFNALDVKDMIIPSSLDVNAMVMYTNAEGVSCTTNAIVRLPFSLVARPSPPVKNPYFVMQLNTDKEKPPSLLEIFSDMTYSSHISENIFTVVYTNGADATILVSKNASRFRLQASTMEALWLLADELRRRLYDYYGPEVKLSVPDPIPLENYYRVIETHIDVRKEMTEAQEALSKAAQMFRVIQKRLLELFRERNPAPVGTMDVLLEESYNNLQKCTDTVTSTMLRLRQACAMLCCCSRLVVLMLVIKCQETLKKKDDIRLLESIFTCEINSDNDVGWEEITDTLLERLLQGSLNRTVKSTSSGNDQLAVNLDGGRLKKRIGTLFEKILTGSLVTFS